MSRFSLQRAGPWLLRLGGLIVFPILALVGIDFVEVGRSLGRARIELAIAAFAILQADIVLRTWRWRIVAEAVGISYPHFKDFLVLFYLGLFAGVAVPQTAASFAPVFFMAEDGHSWQRSAGSIVLDRFIQVLLALLFALAAAIYLYPVLPRLSVAVIIVSGSTLLALGGAYALRRQIGLAVEALGSRYSVLSRWSARLHVPDLARVLREQRARLSRAALLGMLIVCVDAAFAVVAAMALDIDASWVFIAMAWSIVALVLMLPISVAGLGPREGMFVVLFAAVGQPQEEAIALGLLMFALFLPARALGIIAWATRRIRAAPTPASPAIEGRSDTLSR